MILTEIITKHTRAKRNAIDVTIINRESSLKQHDMYDAVDEEEKKRNRIA